MLRGLTIVRCSVFCLALGLGVPLSAVADKASQPVTAAKAQPPKNAFDVLNIFKDRLSDSNLYDGTVTEVKDEDSEEVKTEPKKEGPVFVSSDPAAHIVPPDQDPRVRINPEAPGPFIGMATAYQDGDMDTARKYADQYVRYQMNLVFQVRDLTQMIGQAMVRQGLLDEEDWVGGEQYLDWEMAKASTESGATIKATHEEAMKRIKPDSKGQAEIYFFFTLDCSWCRKMAPDIERLWRVTKGDSNLKMVALTMGPQPEEWIKSYREYTGLTAPIFEGADVAKTFHVAFTPALVVVAPNSRAAYFKTGQQSFERMYEFVRTVQGLPTEQTPEVQALQKTAIGQVEMSQARAALAPVADKTVVATQSKNKVSVERF